MYTPLNDDNLPSPSMWRTGSTDRFAILMPFESLNVDPQNDGEFATALTHSESRCHRVCRSRTDRTPNPSLGAPNSPSRDSGMAIAPLRPVGLGRVGCFSPVTGRTL
jgi:hypothetical protein